MKAERQIQQYAKTQDLQSAKVCLSLATGCSAMPKALLSI
jgi:hypothetical protein